MSTGLHLQWQDPGVRAQDDFYRHMFGHWLDEFAIPEDKAEFASFTELHDLSQGQLRAIIDELAATNPDPGTNAGRIAVLFNAFMDTDACDARGVDGITDLLDGIDALAANAELPRLLGELERLGIGSPIGGAVHQDNRDSTQYVLDMWQSGLGLPDRDYYLQDSFAEVRTAYKAHMARMFELSGVGDPDDVEAIYELEQTLARAHWSNVKNRDPIATYNQYPLSELAQVSGDYAWSDYLDAVGVSDRITTLNIAQPDYVAKATELLTNGDLAGWKAYLRWRVLSAFAALLTSQLSEESFSFYGKTLRGIPEQRPRWKRGVDLVEGMVGEALGQVYVERHFPASHKIRMLELVENLLVAFEQSIDGLEWMTDATKSEAHTKLKSFTAKIGYPDVWRDYSQLTVVPGDLVGSVRAAREFHHQYEVDKLGGPVNRDEWHMNPQTVNAYYNPEMNEIVFPAAILQPPFFTMAADDAVNYGAIGAVIGHEISHGFDDQGSQFDGVGNLRNWWTDDDHAAFKERTSALVAQYAEYEPVSGYRVNGELTLGENIADVSGLAVAHRAYEISLHGQLAPVIDGLTGPQRFFMGFAQVWRAKTRDEETIRRITIDPHSPPEFRVLGTLANTDEFFEAFGVGPTDGMWTDPDERVRIW